MARNPLDMAANLAVSGLTAMSNVTVAMAGAAGGALSSSAKAMMSGESGFFDETVTVSAATRIFDGGSLEAGQRVCAG